MEPLHQSYMRGIELRALIYELPQMFVGLLAGSLAGYIFAWIINRYSSVLSPREQQLIFAGFVAVGMAGIFWGASYYPRRALLFDDRMRLVMAFGSREVPYAEIKSFRVLAPEEPRRTFVSLRFVSMSPAITGAVELRRKRGRAWVFSPEDAEELVALVRARMAGPAAANQPSSEPGAEVAGPGEGS